jgi:alkyl hydroperoxide reductase subunit D
MLIPPLPESEATDKAAQTYQRLHDLLGPDPLPEPFLIYGRVPAFLQDFYMNFKKFVYSDGALEARTKALIGLAVCAQRGCKAWTSWCAARLRGLGAGEQEMADAVAVGAACAMYNAFFKFRDLSGEAAFSGMAVGLRAHTFAGTSLSPQQVELINVAVSDVNGCKPCTSGHVAKARELGLSDEAILEAVQCAATLLAGITFLQGA